MKTSEERKSDDSEHIEVIEFDHHFLDNNPVMLDRLSKLYCSVWERDENFGEYRICPRCNKYFSWEQVERDSVVHCSECGSLLDVAWKPEKARAEILDQSQSNGFSGALAVDGDGAIYGFSWAVMMSTEKVVETWGSEVALQLREMNPQTLLFNYFDELAVNRDCRGRGIGTLLAKRVLQRCHERHSHCLGFLRTHRNSPSVSIYQKLGYKIFCEDTQYGDGRVILCVPMISMLDLGLCCSHS